ncbi:MAG: RsmG family class I SAM-dependent methyltransferase, partial [Campylobacteraceae bacterium]
MIDFNKLPASFVPKQEEVERFCDLLLMYNKTHNISGSKNKNDVLENMFDSLYPLQFLDFIPKSIIDIGSGAGFPALVLA